MLKYSRLLVFLLALLMILYQYVTWPYLRDDALIHLRYAEHLLHDHIVSYDGIHRDSGTSSPLFVIVLAGLRAFSSHWALPRVLGSAGYVGLIALLATLGLRRQLPDLSRWAFLVTLVILLTPSSFRWLNDGMETPWALLITVLLAHAVHRRTHIAWLAVLGCATVMLRIEMLLLIVFCALLIWLFSKELTRVSALLAGAALGAMLVILLTGSLLPNTAAAKADGLHAWAGTLHATGSVFASSLTFGVGLFAVWLFTLAVLPRWDLRAVAANTLFPVTLTLACLRGQKIQGIRYFAWTLVFSIVWNALNATQTRTVSSRLFTYAQAWAPRLGIAACVLFVALSPLEWRLVAPLFSAQNASLHTLASQHLDALSDLHITAYDVGYIGYFTNAKVCDLAGLVNGHSQAVATDKQRLANCTHPSPDMAFLAESQFDDLSSVPDHAAWRICAQADMPNLTTAYTHYLVVAPQHIPRVCGLTGLNPVSMEAVSRSH